MVAGSSPAGPTITNACHLEVLVTKSREATVVVNTFCYVFAAFFQLKHIRVEITKDLGFPRFLITNELLQLSPRWRKRIATAKYRNVCIGMPKAQ